MTSKPLTLYDRNLTTAMATIRTHKHTINRITWIVIFLLVSVLLAWAEWRNGPGSGVGWFLAVSLWSAVSGIGFSICDWLLRGKAQSPDGGKRKVTGTASGPHSGQ